MILGRGLPSSSVKVSARAAPSEGWPEAGAWAPHTPGMWMLTPGRWPEFLTDTDKRPWFLITWASPGLLEHPHSMASLGLVV